MWLAGAAALILHKSSEYWATLRLQQFKEFPNYQYATGGRSGVAHKTKQANLYKHNLPR